MKKPEGWQLALFCGGFFVAAWVIKFGVDSVRYTSSSEVGTLPQASSSVVIRPLEPQPPASVERRSVEERFPTPAPTVRSKPPEVRPKTPEEIAAEKAQYQAQYFDTRNITQISAKPVAIFVVDENGRQSGVFTKALIQKFQPEVDDLLSSFFTTKFYGDGLMSRVMDASAETLSALELERFLSGVVLAVVKVDYSTKTELQDLFTATMTLELVSYPLGSGIPIPNRVSFSSAGPGFNHSDARRIAEERLLKAITKHNQNLFP